MTVQALWTIIIAIAAGITSIASAWKVMKPAILKPITDIDNKLTRLAEDSNKADADIKQRLGYIDEQVGTIQRQKMMWAYNYYGVQLHPISIQTKTSLEAMYDQYTIAGKHNHVPHDFKQMIGRAPIG